MKSHPHQDDQSQNVFMLAQQNLKYRLIQVPFETTDFREPERDLLRTSFAWTTPENKKPIVCRIVDELERSMKSDNNLYIL
uniref:Uncharacterized protein n=1 Tax=Kalanchoe fedtschenkoi TaxID=63787 RepID=A0A7N0TD65_KALFE